MFGLSFEIFDCNMSTHKPPIFIDFFQCRKSQAQSQAKTSPCKSGSYSFNLSCKCFKCSSLNLSVLSKLLTCSSATNRALPIHSRLALADPSSSAFADSRFLSEPTSSPLPDPPWRRIRHRRRPSSNSDVAPLRHSFSSSAAALAPASPLLLTSSSS